MVSGSLALVVFFLIKSTAQKGKQELEREVEKERERESERTVALDGLLTLLG